MRGENEMLDLIISTARTDTRVLAAYLKGSRANPNAPKDIYRDFDVMYVVTETGSFIRDTSWMNAFGRVALMQEQDSDFGYGERFGIRSKYGESYSWLLLFDDGNRIDIGVETLRTMESGVNRNRLFVPLLDKTGCLPSLPPPSDEDFHIKSPRKRDSGAAATSFSGACVTLRRARQETNCPSPWPPTTARSGTCLSSCCAGMSAHARTFPSPAAS